MAGSVAGTALGKGAFTPTPTVGAAPKGPEQYRYGKYFVAFNDGAGDWGIYRLVDFLNPALTGKGVDNIWDCATEDDAVRFMSALDAIQDAANAAK